MSYIRVYWHRNGLFSGCHHNTHTFLEDQLSVAVGSVHSDVLLQVCVLVVVDAQAVVARGPRQILHQTGLARRRRALQQNRVPPGVRRNDAYTIRLHYITLLACNLPRPLHTVLCIYVQHCKTMPPTGCVKPCCMSIHGRESHNE